VHVLDHNNSPPEKQLIFKANEDSIEREAFVLPSGCLAFSCYEDNSHDEEETDSLENSEEISLKGILEIQEFAPKI
jgi:hypothetical protein